MSNLKVGRIDVCVWIYSSQMEVQWDSFSFHRSNVSNFTCQPTRCRRLEQCRISRIVNYLINLSYQTTSRQCEWSCWKLVSQCTTSSTSQPRWCHEHSSSSLPILFISFFTFQNVEIFFFDLLRLSFSDIFRTMISIIFRFDELFGLLDDYYTH